MSEQMSVDLNDVVMAYRTRLAEAIHENTLLTVALQQTQQEVAQLRAAEPPSAVAG